MDQKSERRQQAQQQMLAATTQVTVQHRRRFYYCCKDKVLFKYLGLLNDYNRVKHFLQEVHLSSLDLQGWETSSPNKQQLAISTLTTDHPILPLPTHVIETNYNNDGPAKGTPEHAILAKKHDFKYYTLLGEIYFVIQLVILILVMQLLPF